MSVLSPELRWLIKQARPLRSLYFSQLSIVALSSVLNLLDPLILKWLIDDVLAWRKGGMLPLVMGVFLTLFLFRFCLASGSRLIDTYTGQRLMFGIRLGLLRHLQSLSAAFYQKTPRGELLHRVEQDVEQLSSLSGQTLASVLRLVIMAILSLLVMLVLNWKLALVVMPLVPLMVVLRHFSQARLARASSRVQEACGRRYVFFETNLATMSQLQLFNRQASERRHFTRIARSVLDAMLHRRIAELALAFSYQLSMATAAALVLGLGGGQVLKGTLTIGGLVAFHSYLARIFDPMESVILLYSDAQRATVSIRRMKELLDTQPTIVDRPNPRRLEGKGPLGIEFRGVRFAYQEGHPVLDCLDLRIEPGERVALVGANGSGKSTIATLLTRQYDPQEGELLFDGTPVKCLRLRELRSRVALVPQEPVLFNVSLKENLRYAAPKASDEELRQAIARAQLSTTVEELEEGWLTAVGPRGERLSGGQRQRVAVARAVMQGARLLILDEATSALDGTTEYHLLRSLEEVARQRTVVVIAHRLSAILWAHRIVVLEGGKVLADGRHADLYRDCAVYRQLCDTQLQQHEPGAPAEYLHWMDGRAP